MSRTIMCPFCNGNGFRSESNYFGVPGVPVRKKCNECEGTGRIDISKCRKQKRR